MTAVHWLTVLVTLVVAWAVLKFYPQSRTWVGL